VLAQDTSIATLVDIIIKGIPDNRDIEPENTREYFRVRSELPTTDPVVLYGKRVIIPTSLQAEGWKVLHTAHQGTTGMTARAMDSVHWHGMQTDSIRKMVECTSCDKCAPPSQPAAKLEYSDYLTQHGRMSFIIVDSHSARSSVYDVGKKEGAQNLTPTLKTNHTAISIIMEIA
jgi:hypothetical protein